MSDVTALQRIKVAEHKLRTLGVEPSLVDHVVLTNGKSKKVTELLAGDTIRRVILVEVGVKIEEDSGT